MARITGPVCRLCRRDGLKLFLKGTRCDTPKCAIERRDSAPGMHQFRRGKQTDYGTHLREKQKVKHYYGVLERQFRRYFERAARSQGQHRQRADEPARAALGQRRASAGLWPQPGPGPAVDHRTATLPSTAATSTCPATSSGSGDVIRVKNRAKSLQFVQANLARIAATSPTSCRVIEGGIPEGRVVRLPGSRGYFDPGPDPIDRRALLEVMRFSTWSAAATLGTLANRYNGDARASRRPEQ